MEKIHGSVVELGFVYRRSHSIPWFLDVELGNFS